MKSQYFAWTLFVLVLLASLYVAGLGSGYYAQTLFTAAMYVLLAYGWNTISGFTGYVSFGQVGFFGVGAYLAAMSMLYGHLPWYLAIVVAAIGSVLLALPLGMIMLRLKGIFFALGMLGLAQILEVATRSMDVTGGAMGTTVPTVSTANESAIVMALFAACAVVLAHLILRTRFGLRLMAVRDDDVAAQAAGVDVFKIKIAAFCISATLAGIGGAMYVWNIGYLDPGSAFSGTIELQTILMVLAGGIGTTWGPLLGSIIVSVLNTLLWANFPQEQHAILGLLIVFIATVAPGGLISWINRLGWLKRPIIFRIAAENADSHDVPAAVTNRESTGDGTKLLHCESVGIRFGGVVAVDGVDLEARRGELLAVIGPNGAGKSSLFNLLSSFARPTQGQIYLVDRPINTVAPHVLAREGLARTFQTSRLFRSLTVWETVLVAALARHSARRTAVAATRQLLHEVDLWDQAYDFPDTLSPGQQRLLEIARALALQPRVLLLDEAMAGMSAHEIERVHDVLIKVLERNGAIVAVEHVLPAIAPLASRVQVLDFGKTIAEGDPGQVLTSDVVVEAYLGSEDEMAANV